MVHSSIYGKENWEGPKSSWAVENQCEEPLPHEGPRAAVRNNRKELNISKETPELSVGAK